MPPPICSTSNSHVVEAEGGLAVTRVSGREEFQLLFLGAEFQDTPFPLVFQIRVCGYIEKLVQNSY